MKIISILITLLLSACAVSPQNSGTIDYGSYPKNHEEIVKSYMQRMLKDPYSAVYTNVSGPGRFNYGYFSKQSGYAVCMRINAKNSFGGYTGNNLYFFLIKNGSVVAKEDSGTNNVSTILASSLCEKVVYEPPPYYQEDDTPEKSKEREELVKSMNSL